MPDRSLRCRTLAALVAAFISAASHAQTPIPFVVNDLYVMPFSILGNYQPGPLTTFNGYAYFAATSAVNGRELWRTDGTSDGTTLVRDINPGAGNSSPDNFTVCNGVLYFTADDGTHGREIWRTDGTAAGTRMIIDGYPGSPTSGPEYLASTPAGLVFHASGPALGPGLCSVYDGSTVSSLNPLGACCLRSGACVATSTIACATQAGLWGGLGVPCDGLVCNHEISVVCCMPDKSCVYAVAPACAAQGGTPGAANVACGSCPDPATFVCCAANGTCTVGPLSSCLGAFLFITSSCSPAPCAQTPRACCLPSGQCFMMRFDTECADRSGTQLAANLSCTSTSYDARCAQQTFACCRTTGLCVVQTANTCRASSGFIQAPGVTCAAAGCFVPNTTLVSPESGRPVPFGNRAVEFAFSSTGGNTQLWITDGTIGGTAFLGSGPASVYIPGPSSVAHGRMYFTSANSANPPQQLWSTDGTPAGTGPVPLPSPLMVYDGVASADFFYFTSPDAANHTQLWRTDGTAAGAAQLTNFSTGLQSPLEMVPHQGGLMFNVPTLSSRRQWWFTDGTVAGTHLVGPAAPTDLFASAVTGHASLNGLFYFAAGPSGQAANLWVTDGTPPGTRQVYPIPEAEQPAHPGDTRNWSGLGPSTFSVFGGRLFFNGTDYANFNRPETDVLWSSDGTLDGTAVVAHIYGAQQPGLSGLTAGSNEDLFFAAESAAGNELFVTSGSPSSTRMVKDIYPGTGGSYPSQLAFNNGVLMFNAKSPATSNTPSVFRSDGTDAGTYIIGSNQPYCCGGSRAFNLVGLNNQLLYVEASASTGLELWHSDGTPSGTGLVAEAIPGAADGFWNQDLPPAVFNGMVFYFAKNGIYRSDGTASGTVQLLPISGGQSPSMFVPTSIGVFFTGPDGGLWMSNGTPAGTLRLNTIGPSAFDVSTIRAVGGLAYLAGYSAATGWELWASDGTAAGTRQVADLTPGNPSGFNGPRPAGLRAANGLLYFFMPNSSGVPLEWYATDGTAAGTRPVFAPGEFPSTIAGWFEGLNGALYIVGKSTSPTRYNLWSYTGTVAGLAQLNVTDPLDASVPYGNLYPAGSVAYITRVSTSNSVRALYRTDGTPEGTTAISTAGLPPGTSSFSQFVRYGNDLAFVTTGNPGGQVCRTLYPTNAVQVMLNLAPTTTPQRLTSAGPLLFYTTPTPLFGWQVFALDATGAPPTMIGPVNTGVGQFAANAIRTAGPYFYLDGGALYRSDGTTAGSLLLNTFTSGGTLSSAASLNGVLYFRGSTTAQGAELWRSDGSTAGTYMVKDLAPGAADSGPAAITAVGNQVFFSAGNIPNGNNYDGAEPCASDGTDPGTRQVKKLCAQPGCASYPEKFADLNGLAIFVADNYTVNGVGVGNEIFRSDGTATGTYLLKDILPGGDASYPRDLVAAGEYVFFTADDVLHGRELWRTDGTPAGTVIVKDICVGDLGSAPANLVAAGDRIFFTAYTPETGIELWTSDGSPAGTFMLFEIIPGPSSADIKSVTRAGDRIYFQATVPPQRPSLWSFDWFGSLTAHFLCPADYNRADGPSVQDIFDFLNDWFAGASRADINGNGHFEVQDIFEFINVWLAGC
ncbi:MAG TPA: GC-type dockerin domain-anchored protein [Phycisphaerales bacterium]|nr:GC-type dockerin domain-anchored protein [Phycisphaerales bacterium]